MENRRKANDGKRLIRQIEMNLIVHRFSETAQTGFVTVALLGLLLLSTGGLSGLGNYPPATETVNHSSFHTARVTLVVPVLFLGYDLAGLTIERNWTYS